MKTKICTKCEKEKPLSDFNKHKASKDKRRPECKKCRYATNYYKGRSDYERKSRLRKQYGMTLVNYDEMFEKQGGVCYICKEPQLVRRLSIDHNHITGKVRKLLCVKCNTLVGVIENRYNLVEKTLNYIKEN